MLREAASEVVGGTAKCQSIQIEPIERIDLELMKVLKCPRGGLHFSSVMSTGIG